MTPLMYRETLIMLVSSHIPLRILTNLTSTVDKMFTLDFSSVGKDSTYLAISAKNFLYLDFFNYLDTYKG
jgi:hypothetical protein